MPLVCLDGRAETLAAALRYLLFALLGSVLYLLGAVLLYGAYGTLDIVAVVEPGSCGAGRLGGDVADDGGAAGQGRALPVASVAAARSRRRAGPGQRGTVGAGRQGAVLSGGPAVVRRHAQDARPGGGAAARRPGAPRQSCSAALLRCARCG